MPADEYVNNYIGRIKSSILNSLLENLEATLPSWAMPVTIGETLFIRHPRMVPIHWIRPQSELVAQRGRRVVLSNGEILPRAFHNPIISGDPFHVAWQRVGATRKPIRYALDNPADFLTDRVIQAAEVTLA